MYLLIFMQLEIAQGIDCPNAILGYFEQGLCGDIGVCAIESSDTYKK